MQLQMFKRKQHRGLAVFTPKMGAGLIMQEQKPLIYPVCWILRLIIPGQISLLLLDFHSSILLTQDLTKRPAMSCQTPSTRPTF